MGTSVAWHLSRLGITNVLVVEREPQLGAGSTGRNAGGVRHQFSHEANIRLSIESIRLLERFADEVGHPADLHQDGYLFLLNSAGAVDTFRRNVDLQRSLGVETEWLVPEDAARLAPGLSVEGVLAATFCRRDGIADPNGVTMGFAKAAQAAGVRILRETDVTGVRVEGGRVTGVDDHARRHCHANCRQCGGSACAHRGPDGRGGRARRSLPPPHLHLDDHRGACRPRESW